MVGHDLAHQGGGLVVLGTGGERHALAQPGLPARRAARAARAARRAPARGRRAASGGGRRPARSAARAGGRSRSGSGVSESQLSSRHAIDSDHIMRLITKSGTHMTIALAARSLRRSRRPGARAGRDLRPLVAARRATSPTSPRQAASSPPRSGAESVLVVRGRGRRAARVPQRLPAPRRPAARGPRRLRQGDPLPLPRLDVPHRRVAHRRPRGPRLPRPRQERARACSPARVETFAGLVFVTLDDDLAPLAEHLAGLEANARALRHRADDALLGVASPASRPTGRSSPTTTSRATTSRSPTRG